KRDYPEAQKVLETALAKVKNSPDLSDSQRAGLQQRLRTRLREVEQHLQTEALTLKEAIRKEEERAARDREERRAQAANGGSGVTTIAKDRITTVREQV